MAAAAVPGRFIIDILVKEISPVAARMYDNLAKLTDCKQVIFILTLGIHRKTNVATPAVFVEVLRYNDLRELAAQDENLCWNFLNMHLLSS